jgi:hypothetical protein
MANLQLWSTIAATWVGVLSAIIGGAITISTYVHDVRGRVSGRQAAAQQQIATFQREPLLTARGQVLAAARAESVSGLDPEGLTCLSAAIVSYTAENREPTIACQSVTIASYLSGQLPSRDLATVLRGLTPIEVLAIARATAEQLAATSERGGDPSADMPSSALGAERLALLRSAYAAAARSEQVRISQRALRESPISVAAVLDFFDSAADCADIALCDRVVVEEGVRRYALSYFYFLEPYVRVQRNRLGDETIGKGLEMIAMQAGYERMFQLPDALPIVSLEPGDMFANLFDRMAVLPRTRDGDEPDTRSSPGLNPNERET